MRGGYLVNSHKVNQNSIYFGRLVHYQEYRLTLKNMNIAYEFQKNRGWEEQNINGLFGKEFWWKRGEGIGISYLV